MQFIFVKDKRLLSEKSNSATLTVQSVLENSYDPEECFARMYTGYVNSIPNRTREVPHARLLDTIDNSKKEHEILGKVNKVNRFGKIDKKLV